MLSEFEYSYFDPGAKFSAGAAYESKSRGGGALSSDLSRASLNASVWLKSGMPLVWFKSSRSVTFDHARGRPGTHFLTVSPRHRAPSAATASATAPLNAFATLASRMESAGCSGALVARSAVPARWTSFCFPRWTTAIAPGGPSAYATSRARARSRVASAALADSTGASAAAEAAAADLLARAPAATVAAVPARKILRVTATFAT